MEFNLALLARKLNQRPAKGKICKRCHGGGVQFYWTDSKETICQGCIVYLLRTMNSQTPWLQWDNASNIVSKAIARLSGILTTELVNHAGDTDSYPVVVTEVLKRYPELLGSINCVICQKSLSDNVIAIPNMRYDEWAHQACMIEVFSMKELTTAMIMAE